MSVKIAKKTLYFSLRMGTFDQLMQTVIAPPALTAKARIADPRFVVKNFPGKQPLDPFLDIILPENTSDKIDKSTF